MKALMLGILWVAAVPFSALAVDGVVLINQSTVMVAGGFPYTISSTGSYKFAGNLVMNTTQAGNHAGNDTAIFIAASNVTLDLNGFTINIVNNISGLSHSFTAIAEVGALTGTTIQNGHIVLTGSGSVINVFPAGFNGIKMLNSTFNNIDNISVLTGGGVISFTGFYSVGLAAGARSVVTRFITDDGSGFPTCPSVIAETVGLVPNNGCVASLNVFP